MAATNALDIREGQQLDGLQSLCVGEGNLRLLDLSERPPYSTDEEREAAARAAAEVPELLADHPELLGAEIEAPTAFYFPRAYMQAVRQMDELKQHLQDLDAMDDEESVDAVSSGASTAADAAEALPSPLDGAQKLMLEHPRWGESVFWSQGLVESPEEAAAEVQDASFFDAASDSGDEYEDVVSIDDESDYERDMEIEAKSSVALLMQRAKDAVDGEHVVVNTHSAAENALRAIVEEELKLRAAEVEAAAKADAAAKELARANDAARLRAIIEEELALQAAEQQAQAAEAMERQRMAAEDMAAAALKASLMQELQERQSMEAEDIAAFVLREEEHARVLEAQERELMAAEDYAQALCQQRKRQVMEHIAAEAATRLEAATARITELERRMLESASSSSSSEPTSLHTSRSRRRVFGRIIRGCSETELGLDKNEADHLSFLSPPSTSRQQAYVSQPDSPAGHRKSATSRNFMSALAMDLGDDAPKSQRGPPSPLQKSSSLSTLKVSKSGNAGAFLPTISSSKSTGMLMPMMPSSASAWTTSPAVKVSRAHDLRRAVF
eukprot:TRINITY_DN46385_c0_g1_i1.p1 TRINITY_DN46385_c0_g1~~TRINITY_DN46385_c0_g1_i1.p1  ORF type:complete len:581 (+),score=149.87 TRINITY_DN46385_c0_g1_i1:73-1743(+)